MYSRFSRIWLFYFAVESGAQIIFSTRQFPYRRVSPSYDYLASSHRLAPGETAARRKGPLCLSPPAPQGEQNVALGDVTTASVRFPLLAPSARLRGFPGPAPVAWVSPLSSCRLLCIVSSCHFRSRIDLGGLGRWLICLLAWILTAWF